METVVVVGRTSVPKSELPYQVDQIEARDIAFGNGQTSADVLASQSDVFVQKSQMGGGSPVIRGFEANRVLLVVDGVRMNNAIYRSGHLQNAITIDPAILEQLEVIYGPGSLLYGSDALGGVVHFRTKDPILQNRSNPNAQQAYATLRYASANREKSGHFHFNLGGNKIASLTSFSFSDFDDLKSGKRYSKKYPDFGKRLYYVDPNGVEDRIIRNPDPHLQVGTGYHQYDFLQKIRWQPNLSYSQILNFQYSGTSDIPRYDQLTEKGSGSDDLSFAEWYYGPQTRLMLSSHSQWLHSGGLFDKALLIAAVQRIDEDRVSRRFQSDSRNHQEENLWVYSLTADFEKTVESIRGQLTYGLEANWNDLQSVAYDDNRLGTIRRPALTRYPDDQATISSYGAYANLRIKFNDKWTSNVGARLSSNSTNIRYVSSDLIQWPSSYTDGIKTSNQAFTWGLNINYQPDPQWVVRTHLGTAFRSPNIDDLAKIRIKGGTASAPNPDLNPEKALHTEVTIAHHLVPSDPRSQVSVTGFYTRLKDAVIQIPFQLPNGDSSFYFDNEWYRVVANANAEKGRMYGLSINGMYTFGNGLSCSGAVNYIKGEATTREGMDEPMAHIPPLYGKGKVGYEKNAFRVELIWRFNGPKKRKDYSSNSADNLDKATPEGTLAWNTLNMYASYQLNHTWTLRAAIENLSDIHYRPFASGLSGAGRNFIVSLTANFGSSRSSKTES
ncbi:MAG: TonB-dependent receptor [Saprospiraceae bacterium]|nr:TonB-dependent receptor [Saprospiraceae bacterium]